MTIILIYKSIIHMTKFYSSKISLIKIKKISIIIFLHLRNPYPIDYTREKYIELSRLIQVASTICTRASLADNRVHSLWLFDEIKTYC